MRILPSRRSSDTDQQLGDQTAVARLDHGIEFLHDHGRRRVRFLDDGVAQIRITPHSTLTQPFSFALDPDAQWSGPSELAVSRNEDACVLTTTRLAVRAHADGRISASDRTGRLVFEDVAPPLWESDAGRARRLRLAWCLRRGERVLGLGDKATGIDRRGHRYENWNTDAYGFKRGSDPLYKSIPFLLVIQPDGTSCGIFVDSFAPTRFDVGRKKRNQIRVDLEEADLALYLLHAENPIGVIELYGRLTGRTPMLPRWALGYHQCRYSYLDEADVRRVAFEFRRRRIPCDTLYFDIHYMDSFRMFTWDRRAFPEPANLIHDLHDDGFTTVAIVDPGISIKPPDDPVLRDGIEQDVFVRHADGRLFEGHVWPGPCHFPDFAQAQARAWWSRHLGSLLDTGVDGLWCDMNEPSVFVEAATGKKVSRPERTMPDDVVHHVDGHESTHRRVHNAYGQQMHRATFEGMRTARDDRRPFTITRAAYAGSQRFGTTWTGDNSATWDQLRLGLEQCLSLNVSGFPFCGTDVGGFSGTPTGELMARWTQAGVLTPLFRNHSSVDTPRQEPWLFGNKVEDACRAAIELRYRLLPYLYTALHVAARRGTPMLRPLDVMHPRDQVIARKRPFGMYLGDALLAYPVVAPRKRKISVYLPEVAGGWYDFHTGAHLPPGNHRVAAPLDRLPLFVRAGTVLPLGPIVQTTADLGSQPLTLRVYPGSSQFTSALYDDAGDGNGDRTDEHFHCDFRGRDDDHRLHIEATSSGSYTPPWEAWLFEVMGLREAPVTVRAGGEETTGSYEDGILHVRTTVGSDLTLERR